MLDIGEVKLMSELQKDKEVQSKSKYYMPVMISLIIGVIYSSGFYYSFNYLSYFDLYRFESLSIPPIYYLVNAALPTIISIAILSFLLFEVPGLTPIFNAIIHNLSVLLILPLITLIIYHYKIISDMVDILLGIIVPFILIGFYFLFLWKRISIQDFFLMWDSKMQMLCLIFLTVLLVYPVGALGELSAMNTIEGDAIIAFNWNGNPPGGMENKEFVPIFHYNGNYYVAERMKPAPKNPIVYVIPENQVESAVIKVVNKDNISKSSSMQKYNN